jgi:cytochrome d ubiquinol oxidase subunit II
MPFLLSVFMFWLGYSGLTISVWPWLVPYAVTIGEAAAPDKTLVFMLWGFAIFIPLNLIYTAHAYWAFRGKTGADGGYGH